MLKPLLRVNPRLSGNVKIACYLTDYNQNDNTVECNIREARLYPISSNLVKYNNTINLLNSSYEYDLKKFYKLYSNVFYTNQNNFRTDEILQLDKTRNNQSRNTDFEMGAKRISYLQHHCDFAFFAPIWIESIEDVPAYFILTVKFNNGNRYLTKNVKINLCEKQNSKNYIKNYIDKYANKIDYNVLSIDVNTNTGYYHGIDLKNGGFVNAKDTLIQSIFTTQNSINNFDAIICNGYKRTFSAIRQVLPLSFYIDTNNLLTDKERSYFKYSNITFTGNYYDANNNICKYYDFQFNYDELYINKYMYNSQSGEMENIRLSTNVMGIDFPSMYEKGHVGYRYSNKIAPVYHHWKLLHSLDSHPYIANNSYAFTKVSNSSQTYGEFPADYQYIKGYTILNSNNRNLIMPFNDNNNYYTNGDKNDYKTMFNQYSFNWFGGEADVKNGYTYYNGILYNFADLKYENGTRRNIDKFTINIIPEMVYVNTDNNEAYQVTYVKDENGEFLHDCVAFRKSDTSGDYINLSEMMYNKDYVYYSISELYNNEIEIDSSLYGVEGYALLDVPYGNQLLNNVTGRLVFNDYLTNHDEEILVHNYIKDNIYTSDVNQELLEGEKSDYRIKVENTYYSLFDETKKNNFYNPKNTFAIKDNFISKKVFELLMGEFFDNQVNWSNTEIKVFDLPDNNDKTANGTKLKRIIQETLRLLFVVKGIDPNFITNETLTNVGFPLIDSYGSNVAAYYTYLLSHKSDTKVLEFIKTYLKFYDRNNIPADDLRGIRKLSLYIYVKSLDEMYVPYPHILYYFQTKLCDENAYTTYRYFPNMDIYRGDDVIATNLFQKINKNEQYQKNILIDTINLENIESIKKYNINDIEYRPDTNYASTSWESVINITVGSQRPSSSTPISVSNETVINVYSTGEVCENEINLYKKNNYVGEFYCNIIDQQHLKFYSEFLNKNYTSNSTLYIRTKVIESQVKNDVVYTSAKDKFINISSIAKLITNEYTVEENISRITNSFVYNETSKRFDSLLDLNNIINGLKRYEYNVYEDNELFYSALAKYYSKLYDTIYLDKDCVFDEEENEKLTPWTPEALNSSISSVNEIIVEDLQTNEYVVTYNNKLSSTFVYDELYQLNPIVNKNDLCILEIEFEGHNVQILCEYSSEGLYPYYLTTFDNDTEQSTYYRLNDVYAQLNKTNDDISFDSDKLCYGYVVDETNKIIKLGLSDLDYTDIFIETSDVSYPVTGITTYKLSVTPDFTYYNIKYADTNTKSIPFEKITYDANNDVWKLISENTWFTDENLHSISQDGELKYHYINSDICNFSYFFQHNMNHIKCDMTGYELFYKTSLYKCTEGLFNHFKKHETNDTDKYFFVLEKPEEYKYEYTVGVDEIPNDYIDICNEGYTAVALFNNSVYQDYTDTLMYKEILAGNITISPDKYVMYKSSIDLLVHKNDEWTQGTYPLATYDIIDYPQVIYNKLENSDEYMFDKYNINVYDKDGLTYGEYNITIKLDNTKNCFSLKSEEGITPISFTRIDNYNIENVNNDNTKKYLLTYLKHLLPFVKYDVFTDILYRIKFMVLPSKYNIDIHYTPIFNSNGTNTIIFSPKTVAYIQNYRYMNYLTPLLLETSNYEGYNYKYKETDSTLLSENDTVSTLYKSNISISYYDGFRIYTDKNTYKDMFLPIEFKHYNVSTGIMLEHEFEINCGVELTYEQLLELQTDTEVFNHFKTYINNYIPNKINGRKITETDIRYLLLKYSIEYDSVPNGINYLYEKIYKMKYKFKLY